MTAPIERAVEYPLHDRCTPLRSVSGCIVCDQHDNLHCARGRHCVVRGGASIGEWIGHDSETGHPRHASAQAFEFPTLPGVLFCEDCIDDIESGFKGLGDPIIEGDVAEIGWSVHSGYDGFFGYLATADRTGGILWDRELDSHDWLGVAVVFARTEAERLVAIEAAGEAAGRSRPAPREPYYRPVNPA